MSLGLSNRNEPGSLQRVLTWSPEAGVGPCNIREFLCIFFPKLFNNTLTLSQSDFSQRQPYAGMLMAVALLHPAV